MVGIKMDQGSPLTDEKTEAQKMKQLTRGHMPGRERNSSVSTDQALLASK